MSKSTDAPPSYDFATLPGAQGQDDTQARRPSHDDGHMTDGSSDQGPDEHAIPLEDRLSMDEESRELPEGWVRMYRCAAAARRSRR